MSTSFGYDFAHALPAHSIDDEYRQIERLYGPRNRSWEFVRQSLSMQGPKRFDIITIRMTPRAAGSDPVTRDIYFDVTSFMGGSNAWPDHAAGRILPGAEMNVGDITGAGQATAPTTSYGPTLLFVGLAAAAAYGLGRMAGYRGVYRSNPCGCQHRLPG